MKSWVVYALLDPRTSEIRYVGVTHRTVRLTEHLSKARRGERTYRSTWVRSLLGLGLEPTVSILESGAGPAWPEREAFWIAECRKAGCNLTNATDGGEGILGWKPNAEQRSKMAKAAVLNHTGKKRSLESRKRMSEARKRVAAREAELGVRRTYVRSLETLEKMAASQRGKKASEATRKKLSLSHSNPSQETRDKLRAAVLKRPVEVRAAFACNQKGKLKSDETKRKMSEARKRYWEKKKSSATESSQVPSSGEVEQNG